jgi:hypothetical protein
MDLAYMEDRDTRGSRVSTVVVFIGLLLSAHFSVAQTPGPVQWTNLVKTTAGASGTIQKSTGCAGCPDAGATSVQTITGNGYVELTPVAGQRIIAGLGTTLTASTDPALIDYAFGFWPDGGWDVRERGVYKTDGRWVGGDVFLVERASGNITFFKNGVLVYVSATASSAPLTVDTTIYSQGAAFTMASVTTDPRTVRVPAGADLQAALNAAAPGTTLVLDAGARYVGNFQLPSQSSTGDAIVLTSSANVPPSGERVNAALANALAIIETPNDDPAIDATTGAHNYRFVGLTFKAGSTIANDIVRLGIGTETDTTLYPSGFVFDRVIIRGDPAGGAKRGILANAHDVTLINSDIRDIFRTGQDTTTFGCFNCGKGYTVRNNYLEAGSEVVIFGGAASVARTVAENIVVENNVLTRPLSWKDEPIVNHQVKNLFELKEGLHVVVRGNVMFNNWRASQPGTAIVLTPRDEGKFLQDVLFENNVVYNSGSMIGLSGKDNHYYTPFFSNELTFRNNLFIISSAAYGGDGRLVLFTAAPNGITFDHNTVISDGGSLVAAYDSTYMDASGGMVTGGAVENLTFTNNVVPNGEYGFIANGSMNGAGFVYFPGVILTSNVIAGYTGWRYPPGNFYPTLAEFQGLFLNYAAADYRPSATMPVGTDGTPMGANFASLPPR